MLLEFTCSNYKSIHKRVKLSMIAGSDDTREDELIQYDKYRINRMSVRYGPNGSGKTVTYAIFSHMQRGTAVNDNSASPHM